MTVSELIERLREFDGEVRIGARIKCATSVSAKRPFAVGHIYDLAREDWGLFGPTKRPTVVLQGVEEIYG